MVVMERWAIYRIHYGLDFLKRSIDSVRHEVDRVFVYYSLTPWVEHPTVNYLGETIPMPDLHEDVQTFLYQNYRHKYKIRYARFETESPANQFAQLYRQSVDRVGYEPTYALFMEPDMVFYRPSLVGLFEELDKRTDIPCLGTKQVELWKNNNWRVPQRDRIGPMIWATKRVDKIHTYFGTWHEALQIASSHFQNYNFGFCLNDKTMLYKHLTAINFSRAIGDSIPSQEWYRDKWLNWTPDTTNLEISEKYKHLIPKAEPYQMCDEMKKQMEQS